MYVTTKPQVGLIFTHLSQLDLDWEPEPGQTWAKDAPKATMQITKVNSRSVYYKRVGRSADSAPKYSQYTNSAHFCMTRKLFEERYCTPASV